MNPINERIAKSDPSNISLIVEIVIKDLKLIVILIIGLISFVLLNKYIIPTKFGKVEWIVYLAWVIYGFCIWGIYVAVKSLTKFQVEIEIANWVENKSLSRLRNIRDKSERSIDLEEVRELIPDNKSNLQIIRLFQLIIDEAVDRKYENSTLLTQSFKEDSYKSIYEMSAIQKMSLQIGILGTFIGLTLTFWNLDPKIDLKDILPKITNSLQFAFGTSIAGLEVAIMLAMIILQVKNKQEYYFASMEKSASSLTALVRNSHVKDDFLREFHDINSNVNTLCDKVSILVNYFNTQNKEITEVIGALRNSRNDLDKFLTDMKADLALYYSIISPKEISENLKNSLIDSVKGVSDVLNSNLINVLSEYDIISKSIKSLNEKFEKLSNDSILNNQLVKETTKEVSIRHLEILNQIKESKIFDDLNKNLKDLITSQTISVTKQVTEFSSNIGNLENHLSKFNEATNKYIYRANEREAIFLKYRQLFFIGLISIVFLFFSAIIYKILK